MPRGADRVATAARSAPLTSSAWGVVLWIVAAAARRGAIGDVRGAARRARAPARDRPGVPRRRRPGPCGRWGGCSFAIRDLAGWRFFAGWAIAVAVSLVPYLNVAAWVLAAVFGSGAMTVATWRARGGGGRHRAGYVEPGHLGARDPRARRLRPSCVVPNVASSSPATSAKAAPAAKACGVLISTRAPGSIVTFGARTKATKLRSPNVAPPSVDDRLRAAVRDRDAAGRRDGPRTTVREVHVACCRDRARPLRS